MGLDSVELVMECEDEFGIIISDEDASRTTTPRQLANLIVRLLSENSKLNISLVCTSAHVFYKMRSRLMRSGVQRDSVHPDTQMGVLLDAPNKVSLRRSSVGTVIEMPCRSTLVDNQIKFLRLVPLCSLLVVCSHGSSI